MTPEQLFKIIQDIYNTHQFSSKLLIDNFMIISKDNYYLCYHELDNGLLMDSNSWTLNKIQFRLEVNYLPSKIGDEGYVEYSMIYDNKTDQGVPTIRIEGDKNIPESMMDKIKPIIRNFRLKTIIEDENIN
jgi:hypothetical protein